MPNNILYGKLPKVSDRIRNRRMRLAGHIQRHDDLSAHNLLLWEPLHGHRRQGAPRITYVDTLRKDTELNDVGDIRKLMSDRKLWRDNILARTLKPP